MSLIIPMDGMSLAFSDAELFFFVYASLPP